MPATSNRTFYLALAAITILLGLVLRLVPVGLPAPIVGYGGSVLWASMVYLLFAALLPRSRCLTLASAATVFAALVELSRLYHTSMLDHFRHTLTGALLLGRVFNPWHFLAYIAAIAATAAVDRAARQ